MPLKTPIPLLVAAALAAGPLGLVAQELPPGEPDALERLNTSPRHGEWVTYDAGMGDEVNAWVVYPETSEPAPVVIVIHEIFGLSDWIRSVADQLAAEGFIAIAPDLISGKGPEGGGSESVDRQGAVRLIRGLDRAEVNRRLQAAAEYVTSLPAAAEAVGVVGFCWGGSSSFAFATAYPELDAAVVFYGSPPPPEEMANIQAPVLGHYGGDDERVTSTVSGAREAMEELAKSYEPHVYDGAGHGFLRQQDGRDGANMRATEQAWPRTLEFFRSALGG